MTCTNCGASIPEGSKFCPKCGLPMSREGEYCAKCGAKLSDDASYCIRCGAPRSKTGQPPRMLPLASWGRRFVAWLIDIAIFGMIPGGVFAGARLDPYPFIGVGSIVAFLYWTLTEGYMWQSVGKFALNLKVTRVNGERITFTEAAVESFGKAFILPLDVVVGWIFFNEKRQRLFSKLSNTIVILTPKPTSASGAIEYRKA